VILHVSANYFTISFTSLLLTNFLIFTRVILHIPLMLIGFFILVLIIDSNKTKPDGKFKKLGTMKIYEAFKSDEELM